MNKLQNLIAQSLPPSIARFNEPMSGYTSFKIGGPADVLLVPATYDELVRCLRVVREHDLQFFVLGGGTNILVSDRGVRGVVLFLGKLSSVTVDGTTLVAQAGAIVESVCRAAEADSLSGIEFIHGMPGTIGGAVWMNARCYGSDIGDVLIKAEVINRDLQLETVEYQPHHFGYKRSPFQTMDCCIWRVHLRLEHGDIEKIHAEMEKNYNDRMDKGHFTAPSAGSLFKNNRKFGAPTGQIIDELGLRGVFAGDAAIAPFHGNIFINQGNASASDVLSLIRLAVETAEDKRNIRLEPEVRLVGDWEPSELAFLG